MLRTNACIGKQVRVIASYKDMVPMSLANTDLYVFRPANQNGHVVVGRKDGKIITMIHEKVLVLS